MPQFKGKPMKIKSLQLYEGFQIQYEQERVDKENKQKENLLKCRWNFRGEEKQYNQLSISRKEDEDIIYDKYSLVNKVTEKEKWSKSGRNK